MTDPRPTPQYGEYATPAEVAAARGMTESELAAESAPPAPPHAVAPPSRSLSSGPPVQPSGRGAQSRPPRHLLTMVLLAYGVWNTVTSIPTFLDLGGSLSESFSTLGYGDIRFGTAAHVVGIVVILFSILLLIGAIALSLRRIRAGRSSLVVPLIAAGVWVLGLIVGMGVVVANTPGLAVMLQNHS